MWCAYESKYKSCIETSLYFHFDLGERNFNAVVGVPNKKGGM